MTNPILPVTPYDQGQAFLNALLKGKVGAAGRAAFAPQTMSPDELQMVLGQQLGYKPRPSSMGERLTTGAMNLFTNPIFLVGLLLAGSAGPLSAKLLQKGAGSKHFRKIGWLRKFFGTPEQVYGKRISDRLHETAAATDAFLQDASTVNAKTGMKLGFETKHAGVIQASHKLKGGPWMPQEEHVIGGITSGMHTPDGMLSKHLTRMGMRGDTVLLSSQKVGEALKQAHIKAGVDGYRNLYNELWKYKDNLPPKVVKAMEASMGRKGHVAGGRESGYWPAHVRTENPMAVVERQIWDPAKVDAQTLRAMVDPVSGHMIQRGHRLIPTDESLRALEKAGLMKDTMYKTDAKGNASGKLVDFIAKMKREFADGLFNYARKTGITK